MPREIQMLKDLRHAARVLLNAKGWTAVVVISLALGIGANTALFSAANGLLLQKVNVASPDTLVRLRFAGQNDMATNSSEYGFTNRDAAGRSTRTTFSYPMYKQFVADNQTMTGLLACAPFGTVGLAAGGEAEIATAFIASGNYFQLLGVSASPGRVLAPDDDRPGAPPAAVISDGFWRRRFGADAGIAGKVVTINNVAVTIVGVIEPGFTGIQQAVQTAPDITVPLALYAQINVGDPGPLEAPTRWWLQVVGRLKPGATADQVRGNLGEVFRQTAKAGLDSYLASVSEAERSTARNRNRTRIPDLVVDSGSRGIYDPNATDRRAVAVLGGVVALVLLLVCANVANLLLSRATGRQKEVSVRLSLGATRGRLIRQLLTESLLLAGIGGALGIAVGYWGQQLLPGTPGDAPIDWRVLAFVAGLSCVTALVFGVVPALRSTAVNVNAALKEQSRSVVASRSWLGRSLLVAQVGISVVLLIGAALFLRTVQNLRQVDVGFDARNLVMFRVTPQLNRYDEARTTALYRDMLDRLSGIAGVRGVAASNPALLSGSVNQSSIFVQGRSYAAESLDSINRLVVTPNFLDVMGIPVMLGRGLTEQDTRDAPRVVLINEAAAKKYFPNQNPIGQRIGQSLENAGQQEIVGVVRDVKYNSVRDEAPPTMYQPHLQAGMPRPSFVARTVGDPLASVGALREAVRQLDPNVPLQGVSTQMEQIEGRIAQEKLFARAYALFGGLALLVASVGLFGLMSYSVARRTSEIGIRMALGAKPADVLRQVMGESMVLVLVGVVLGVAGALAAGRLVASLLFGVQATDAASMTMAVIVLVIVASIAGYLPARRAARVDPMVALHEE
jgi:predicted permease